MINKYNRTEYIGETDYKLVKYLGRCLYNYDFIMQGAWDVYKENNEE